MVPEEDKGGIEEGAVRLRVAKEFIYRWVDSKGFPVHGVGRLLRFKLSEVDQWLTTDCGDDSKSRQSGKTKEARTARRNTSAKKKEVV